MNAYIKFGEKMSVSSQDIVRKQNFGVNQGPKLWYKFAKFGENMSSSSQDIQRKRNLDVNQGP